MAYLFKTTIMKIVKHQIKVIHAILPDEIKLDPAEKKSVIAQFTGDVNLTSTKDLTFQQANELIKSFGGKPSFKTSTPPEASFFKFNISDKKHRTILSLSHQYGWEKENHHVDVSRLGEWLMNKAPVKKPLGKQTSQELSKTIAALENMVAKKFKA